MNQPTAAALAARIRRIWPTMRIHVDEWTEQLLVLDEGTAGTALIRLAKSAEHPPSIAEFFTLYRSLHTAPVAPPGPVCGACGGDGWVGFDFTRNGFAYRGVQPCRCPRGRDNERLHTSICDERDARDRKKADAA